MAMCALDDGSTTQQGWRRLCIPSGSESARLALKGPSAPGRRHGGRHQLPALRSVRLAASAARAMEVELLGLSQTWTLSQS